MYLQLLLQAVLFIRWVSPSQHHTCQLASHGISLTAISSAGSLENLKLLRDNQAQFAILQGPFGAWSWTGEGPVSSPQTHLRSVSALGKCGAFRFTSELTTNKNMSDLNSRWASIRIRRPKFWSRANRSFHTRYPRYRLSREVQSSLYGIWSYIERYTRWKYCWDEYPSRRTSKVTIRLCYVGRPNVPPKLDRRIFEKIEQQISFMGLV